MAGTMRHIASVLMLPFVVVGLIPTLLVISTDSLNPVWGLPFPLNMLLGLIGVGLIGGGLALLALTINLFIRVGRGTLAPWDPTQRLVVVGVYRHVRNPMISGVIAILLGEAALSGSPPLLIWALVAIGVNMVYIPLSEEPGLIRRFGDDYRDYARNVPRWLPRRTAWIPPHEG